MTWVSPNKPPISFQEGLLQYLQSPMSHGISAGLLAASAPSLTPQTIGSGLAQGLLHGQKLMGEDRKLKVAEGGLAESIRHNKAMEEVQRATAELRRAKMANDLAGQQMVREYLNRLVEDGDIEPAEADKAIMDASMPTPSAQQLPSSPVEGAAPLLNDMMKGSQPQLPMSPIMPTPPEPPETLPEVGAEEKPKKKPKYSPDQIARVKLLTMGVKKEVVDALFPDDSQNLTGLPQEYASYEALKSRYGENHPAVVAAKEELDTRRANAKTLGASREKMTALRNWNSLTPDQKENIMAQGRSLGFSDDQLLQAYEQGLTNYDLALSQGLTEEQAKDLDKNFAPTGATRTAIQTTEGALAEEEWIAPHITDAMKPYSRKIFGSSPAFLKDAFSTNPQTQEKVAKALAARAIQPEMAGFRSRAAGGSNAHRALEEITHSSLNEMRIFEAQVSPEVYERAQTILSEWIQGMGKARIDAMKGKNPSAKKALDDNDPLGLRKK